MSSFKILISRVLSKNQFWWEEDWRGSFLTCAVTDQSAEFGTEQYVDMIKDELHNNRLNTNFHKSRSAAETRRLNLFRPATIEEQGMNATCLTQIASLQTNSPKKTLPEKIWSPDNCKIFAVHVGDGTVCSHTG